MIRMVEAPTDGRVETGAVQFGDDWPGLFIRGDDSFNLAIQISIILNHVRENDSLELNIALRNLDSFKDLIMNDVVMKPKTATQ